MTGKILIAVIAVVSLAGTTAADAYKHKRKPHRTPGYAVVQPPPNAFPGPRPPWAPPGSCFTDEGYGRYRPCDAGSSEGR